MDTLQELIFRFLRIGLLLYSSLLYFHSLVCPAQHSELAELPILQGETGITATDVELPTCACCQLPLQNTAAVHAVLAPDTATRFPSLRRKAAQGQRNTPWISLAWRAIFGARLQRPCRHQGLPRQGLTSTLAPAGTAARAPFIIKVASWIRWVGGSISRPCLLFPRSERWGLPIEKFPSKASSLVARMLGRKRSHSSATDTRTRCTNPASCNGLFARNRNHEMDPMSSH
jgi:hypothetical protein